ncbi:MAG: GGDEF domain-containing protein [Magnetococcales bacterium]|nr:GGDEF domain-containing protein [Magnetococcales bacterium]
MGLGLMESSADLDLFSLEEEVLRRAESLSAELVRWDSRLKKDLDSIIAAYRRSYREHARLVRVSDRQQAQLKRVMDELQEKTIHLESLNAALKVEIAQRRELEETLRRLASTDALTGVLTRGRLLELGEREMERMRRSGRPLTLALADIDHFKNINDTYGHAAGDEALKVFTTVCRNEVRAIDILGRFGGEEFVMLFPETDVEKAEEVGNRVRGLVEKQEICHGVNRFAMTVSIGLAAASPDDGSLEEPLHRADTALYVAKRGGRNRVVVA